MSKYDEERKRLTGSSNSTTSKYAAEREALRKPQENKSSTDLVKEARAAQSKLSTTDLVRNARSAQTKLNNSTDNKESKAAQTFLKVKKLDLFSQAGERYKQQQTQTAKDQEFEKNKQRLASKGEFSPDDKILSGMSYLQRVKKVTGQAPTILQPLVAPLAAIAESPAVLGIGQALGNTPNREQVTGGGKVAGEIIAPIGQMLTMPGAGLSGTGLYNQAGNVLERFAPKLVNTVGGRIANEAIKNVVAGTPTGAGGVLAVNPEASGKEIAQGALYGGAGGALIGGLSKGIGEGVGALKGLVNRNAENVVGGQLGQANAFDRANNAPQYAGNLKLDNKAENVSRILSDIKEDVNARMTPPTENEKSLRSWIKPFLGNPSNNELAKLTYDDLLQLSDEAKKGLNMFDVAKDVAKTRGINLEQAFEEAPSIMSTVARNTSRRAYGITPENLPKVSRPIAKTQPEAVPEAINEIGPVKMNWFNRLFGDQGVGISPFGSGRSNNIVTTEQQIVNNPLKNNVQGVVEGTKQAGRSAYQNMVDYLDPLKTISKGTYDTAMDASRANNIANTIIRDKFVDLEGNVIGNSLDDIMKNTRGLGKKFDDYLILRHAETRMGRGERVYVDSLGMTPEKARESINTLESRYPGLKELGDEWDKFNGNMLDSGVREGLISQASRDAMRTQNPHYAAMNRQFTIGEKMARRGGGGSSFSGQNAPIKSVSPTGSTRKIVSPLRSAIEQTYAWKNAELRNRTMQEITKAIQANPEKMKGIAEIVKKPSTSYKSLDDALREGGSEEFLDQLDNDFKTLFKKNVAGDENVVRAMVNGNPVFIKVHNPEAVKALLGLGNEQAGWILAAAQKLSNMTKRSATGLLSPMFAIKSLGGDTIQAAIQSPNALKHVLVDVPHALISSIGDALKIPGFGDLARDFRRSGGEYSALLMGDKGLKKQLGSLRREPFLSPKGIVKGAVNTIKAPFKTLEKIADISENTNRMAAYKRDLVGKERTPENIRSAINAARESTVNFSRRGAISKGTEAAIPYSNAAIQGTYRLARAFKKNPIKTLTGISTLIVGPKLYEYAKFHDDPEYQKLPARERYRNIIHSKNEDGTFNKQPVDASYEAFGAFFMDVLKATVDKDPAAFKGTLDSLAEAWTPPAISGLAKGLTQGGGIENSIAGAINSTVAAPISAVGFNQSFTGAPIVPERLLNNSAGLQADERTTSLAKKVGEKLNFAPMKVDYLMRQYGGDIARLVAPMTSDYGGGTAKNVLLKNFIVDPVFTNNLSNDFYLAKDKYIKALNDNKDFGKPLPKWFTEASYDLLNSLKKDAPAKRLSELGGEKREVTGDRSLSAKEKSDKIRAIQKQINDIYIDVNSKVQNSGFKFPSR